MLRESCVKLCSYILFVVLGFKFRSLCSSKRSEVKELFDDMVLFFPETELTSLRAHGKTYTEIIAINPLASLSRLLSVLMLSRHTLDVCMYSIAFKPFIELIRDLSLNGVRVQLIINGRNTGEDGGEVRKASAELTGLKKYGVITKTIYLRRDAYMHNKFAIIDSNILINGSLNWTKNAIFSSFNDTVITTESDLINNYSKAFKEFWNKASNTD